MGYVLDDNPTGFLQLTNFRKVIIFREVITFRLVISIVNVEFNGNWSVSVMWSVSGKCVHCRKNWYRKHGYFPEGYQFKVSD